MTAGDDFLQGNELTMTWDTLGDAAWRQARYVKV
jgi:hypothetical protein